MLIEGLNKQNLEHMKDQLKFMQEMNPDIKYQILDQSTVNTLKDAVKVIKDFRSDIEAIRTKIDLIFGNYVLIGGRFTELEKIKNAK